MEQTIEESDSCMSKEMVDQMLNNFLNETRSLSNNLLLDVENIKVPDIKLELEIDDYQIELLPHFKENTSVIRSTKHILDCLVHDHNYTKTRTNAATQINTVDNLVYEEWKIKNEEITIKVEKNDDRLHEILSEQKGREIRLEESEAINEVEKMDDTVREKWAFENEELNIKEEGNIEDEGYRLHEILSEQKGREIRIEGSEAINEVKKMDDTVYEKWAIENEEINIKEEGNIEDEEYRFSYNMPQSERILKQGAILALKNPEGDFEICKINENIVLQPYLKYKDTMFEKAKEKYSYMLGQNKEINSLDQLIEEEQEENRQDTSSGLIILRSGCDNQSDAGSKDFVNFKHNVQREEEEKSKDCISGEINTEFSEIKNYKEVKELERKEKHHHSQSNRKERRNVKVNKNMDLKHFSQVKQVEIVWSSDDDNQIDDGSQDFVDFEHDVRWKEEEKNKECTLMNSAYDSKRNKDKNNEEVKEIEGNEIKHHAQSYIKGKRKRKANTNLDANHFSQEQIEQANKVNQTEEIVNNCIKKRKIEGKPFQETEWTPQKENSEDNDVYFQALENGSDKVIKFYDKRHCCFICYKTCLKMSRHLEQQHGDDILVSKLICLDKGSKERRDGFMNLARAGDFYHNMEVLATKSGELYLSRRPPQKNNYSYEQFGPCPYCLGFMLQRYISVHINTCNSLNKHNSNSPKKSTNNIRQESTALVNSVLFKGDAEFRKKIIDTFASDKIALICKHDPVIVGFGSLLWAKHGSSHSQYVRQCMRQMGRLLLTLRAQNVEYYKKDLSFFIDPKYFDLLVTAVKELCKNANREYNEKDQYQTPTLALKIGYHLKKCALFLRGQNIKNGFFIEGEKVKMFMELYNLEWNTRISSNALPTHQSKALPTLQSNQMSTVQLLPLTNDIQKLNKFISTEISIFKVLLEKNPCATTAWIKLAKAVLARITLFNKRRGGEPGKMTLTEFDENPNWQRESTQETLNIIEKQLAGDLKVVQVKENRGRIVSVILTKDMVSTINILMSTRSTCGISPINEYVFADPYKKSLENLRGHECLTQMVNGAKLESPESITSTKLAKYIATVSQIFELKEVDWLARHLGHDIKVHGDFYRLHESAVELTKVSRLLMVIDEGKAAKFMGQALQDIKLTDFPDLEENENFDLEEDINNSLLKQTNSYNKDQNPNKIRGNHQERQRIRRSFKVEKWSQEEMAKLTRHFHLEIKNSKVPGKEECEKFMAENKIKREWRKVKFAVKNYISKLLKLKKV